METETIGQRIDKTVEKYKGIYTTLKECGNKKPAKVMLSEAWINEEFVASRVMEKITELYQQEAEEEDKN